MHNGRRPHLGRHADGVVQRAPQVEQQGIHVDHPARLAAHDGERRQVDAAAAARGPRIKAALQRFGELAAQLVAAAALRAVKRGQAELDAQLSCSPA